MLNTSLLPRPWSCDRPKVEGFEPLINAEVTRIGRRRHNSWRAEAIVDDCRMSISHHDTKAEAETWCARMIKAFAEVHYIQV